MTHASPGRPVDQRDADATATRLRASALRARRGRSPALGVLAIAAAAILLATGSVAAVASPRPPAREPARAPAVDLAPDPELARTPVAVVARDVRGAVDGRRDFRLPIAVSHVALRWTGDPHAVIRVALSRDGRTYGPAVPVVADEGHGPDDAAAASREPGHGETYSSVIVATGARVVRVTSDRPLGDVTVIAMDSRAPRTREPGVPDPRGGTPEAPARGSEPAATPTSSVTEHPPVISRAGWRADESYRFDPDGEERWPVRTHPVQRLFVHHTVTVNDDPHPAATVRAIYYYHAVRRGWGDIGYNFLIDEAGRIYEGRYAREYDPTETPNGEDRQGFGVTAGHALDHNNGTVGIALLGNYMRRSITSAARASLERLLAWKADRYGLDPAASGEYVNPGTGAVTSLAAIPGHRDANDTLCPGDRFYDELPDLRAAVETLVGPTIWSTVAPMWTRLPPEGGQAVFEVGVRRSDGSTDPIDLQVLDVPAEWPSSVTPDPEVPDRWSVTVTVPPSAPDGEYRFRVVATGAAVTRTTHVTIAKQPPPDLLAPVVEPPAVELRADASLRDLTVPVRYSWSSADDRDASPRHDVDLRRDGGAWERRVEGSTDVSYRTGLRKGSTYQARVRATDDHDNRSAWATHPPVAVRLYQESKPRITWSKGWTRVSSSTASGGYRMRATTAGATATITFSGRSFAWVTKTGPTGGLATVTVDGGEPIPVDLAAGAGGTQRLAFTRAWPDPGPHTVTITALERDGRVRVTVDAFPVLG